MFINGLLHRGGWVGGCSLMNGFIVVGGWVFINGGLLAGETFDYLARAGELTSSTFAYQAMYVIHIWCQDSALVRCLPIDPMVRIHPQRNFHFEREESPALRKSRCWNIEVWLSREGGPGYCMISRKLLIVKNHGNGEALYEHVRQGLISDWPRLS